MYVLTTEPKTWAKLLNTNSRSTKWSLLPSRSTPVKFQDAPLRPSKRATWSSTCGCCTRKKLLQKPLARSDHQLNYILLAFYNQASVYKVFLQTHKLRALKGFRVSSKSPSGTRDRNQGVTGRIGGEWCFPY